MDIGSLIFLVLLIGIPLGLVVSIVIMVIRKINNRRSFHKIAEKEGWEYSAEGNDQPLFALLKDRLFILREGDHNLRHIIKRSSEDLWTAEYHYRGHSPYGETRLGGTYSLTVLKRSTPGPAVWMLPRPADTLAAIAETVLKEKMERPEDPDWSWLLVSSVDGLKEKNLTKHFARKLKSYMISGDTLFLFPDYLVFSRKAALTPARVEEMETIVQALQLLL